MTYCIRYKVNAVQLSPSRSFPFITGSFITTIDRVPRLFDRPAGSRMRAHTRRFFRLHPASARLAELAHIHFAGAKRASRRVRMHEVYARTHIVRVRPHPGSARRLMNDQTRLYASRGAQPVITNYRSKGSRHSFLSSPFPYARLFSRDLARC